MVIKNLTELIEQFKNMDNDKIHYLDKILSKRSNFSRKIHFLKTTNDLISCLSEVDDLYNQYKGKPICQPKLAKKTKIVILK